MAYEVKIIEDSVNPAGGRLTTIQMTFPRIVLAEWNTHRSFCLAGDAELEFDLPAGHSGKRRVYRMRLDEFVDKWVSGARRTGANPKRLEGLNNIERVTWYPVPTMASMLGMASTAHMNKACRDGEILGARRMPDGRTWEVRGAEVAGWRMSKPEHTRFDMRAKLRGMRIRQLNEETGDIQWSHVRNVFASGRKNVYEVVAGDFRVAGSADHLIFTLDGWRRIGDLQSGNWVVVRKFGKRDDEKLDPLRLKKIGGMWRSRWQLEQRAKLREKDRLCRRCHATPGDEVHHIVPVCEDPTRAFDADNVTLLCGACHTELHRTQGWQGGTYLYGGFVQVDEIRLRGEEETYDLEIEGRFPNFVASGIIVHNSRNAASSRAIPAKRMREAVEEDPFFPIWWGKNQAGMQAFEQVDEVSLNSAKEWWDLALGKALDYHRLLEECTLHKQISNRLLEPWMWVTDVATATEEGWANFFHLRCHFAAQREICEAALMAADAWLDSRPQALDWGRWHLPYVFPHERREYPERALVKFATARCARVSYVSREMMQAGNLDVDLELYERLLNPDRPLYRNEDTPLHVSPTEHPARAVENYDNPKDWWRGGNFGPGWAQHRKEIEGERRTTFTREDLERRKAEIARRFGTPTTKAA